MQYISILMCVDFFTAFLLQGVPKYTENYRNKVCIEVDDIKGNKDTLTLDFHLLSPNSQENERELESGESLSGRIFTHILRIGRNVKSFSAKKPPNYTFTYILI